MSFTWSADESRYREDGKLVPEARIRSALDTVLQAQAGHARDLTQQMVDGKLNLASWELQMRASIIKSSHLIGASLANGGWEQFKADQALTGWVGQRIRGQYQYLANFAAQLASGDQALDGSAVARAGMYAEAGRSTHRAALTRLAQRQGMEQESSHLGGSRESCALCITEAMRGWVAVGSLVPVGSRTCLSACHCWVSWRMAPVTADA